MTHQEATALQQWIVDHDTRFQANVVTDADKARVELTRPEDGTRLPPIHVVEDYGLHYIEQGDPSPTICVKWEEWLSQLRGAGTQYDQPAI